MNVSSAQFIILSIDSMMRNNFQSLDNTDCPLILVLSTILIIFFLKEHLANAESSQVNVFYIISKLEFVVKIHFKRHHLSISNWSSLMAAKSTDKLFSHLRWKRIWSKSENWAMKNVERKKKSKVTCEVSVWMKTTQ